MREILDSIKSLLTSSKVQTFLVSQFGGLLIVYFAAKAGLPADAISNIVLALLGKMGVETSALMAARSYVDAHTSAASIHADAITAQKAPAASAPAPVPPPVPKDEPAVVAPLG